MSLLGETIQEGIPEGLEAVANGDSIGVVAIRWNAESWGLGLL